MCVLSRRCARLIPRVFSKRVFAKNPESTGVFCKGDHTSDPGICEALQRMGLAVISGDFRQGPEHQHPTAVDDLEDVALVTALTPYQ